MKFGSLSTGISATLFLQASFTDAKHSNAHLNVLERRHRHHKESHVSKAQVDNGVELRTAEVQKRGGECQFPSDAGLVAVSPGSENGGWAMSPNQCCTPGSYCPYACPSGQMMAQWSPNATSYTYPQSMVRFVLLQTRIYFNDRQDGGLYCDNDGNIQKPFPDQPYCVSGTGNIGCTNKASSPVAFCQTVLPGNEAMLIPTTVETFAQLTVPGPEYRCGTAAQSVSPSHPNNPSY